MNDSIVEIVSSGIFFLNTDFGMLFVPVLMLQYSVACATSKFDRSLAEHGKA